MDWRPNDWVAAGSAIVAVASLVLNLLVVRHQTALQFETLKAQMDADVIGWGGEAIHALARAETLARGRSEAALGEAGNPARAASETLSALADRGRLLFPNESADVVGLHKEDAYKGLRPPVLDALVFACCQVEHLALVDLPDPAAAELLVRCRRLLTSEVQNAIDPRRRKQMLRRLAIGRSDDAKSSFEVAEDIWRTLAGRYPQAHVVKVWSEAHYKEGPK